LNGSTETDWRRKKAQNELLMEAIPEQALGVPSRFSCGRGFPLPSVLVDPFNSVARRFSAPA
jgi:hypothetical protein